jgi:CRP-like cAMP-binding protein
LAITAPLFDGRYFQDPEKFDPDRFAPPRSEGVQAHAFSPYGVGRHACLSIGMMEMMVMAMTCGLLRTLDLEIDPPDYEIETAPNPIPGPKASFRIRVRSQRAHVEHATAGARPVLDPESIPIAGLELSAEELARFASKVTRRTYEAGALVLREGDAAEEFFVVVDGEVEVLHEDGTSAAEHVARIGAGGYFGEIGLLYGVPRTATVRAGAAGPATVLVISRAFFTYLVSEHDLVSDEIAEMARRRMLVNQLANVVPGLDKARLHTFSDRIGREHYAAGEVVIQQGDEAHTFYVVADGEAEVVNRHPSGADLVLARLGAGEYFGEIGILQGRPRTATVRAVGNRGLEVLAIDRETLLEMREATHDSGRALAEKALARLVEIQAAER